MPKLPNPIPFPVDLIKWLAALPPKARAREYEIAERNLRRIMLHIGYTE